MRLSTARVTVRPARTATEVQAAYDVAARVFGPNFFESQEQKAWLLALEPPADTCDVIVAIADGQVQGLVRIVDRAVYAGSSVLRVGGITAVAVHPLLRGQGAGRALMEGALKRSRERGDQLSIAFARRAVDGFYWRLGYVGVGRHVRTSVTLPATSPRASRTRSGFDAHHARVYAAAYRATYRQLAFGFKRDAAWWKRLPPRLGRMPATEFVTVFEGRAPSGYVVLNDGVVVEAAMLGAPGAARDAVIERAAGREALLALHPDHPVSRAFAAFNQSTSVRYAWDGGHVVRLLDVPAFTRALGRAVAPQRRRGWVAIDERIHEDARTVLLQAAGASAGGAALALPVWSPVDEF